MAGVCAQQDEAAKFDWGNTGHADMLAALCAVGVDGGRESDGDCCGDSQQAAVWKAEEQMDERVRGDEGVRGAVDGGEMQYLQMETAEGTSGRTSSACIGASNVLLRFRVMQKGVAEARRELLGSA